MTHAPGGIAILLGISIFAGAHATGLYEQGLAAEAQGRSAEAIAHYESAAKSGSGRAARRLGEIYSQGAPGVAVDYANSLRWHTLARALADDAPADPLDAARSFEQAQALEREAKIAEARELYKQAARAGSAPAMVRLGQMYEHGIGGMRDYAESLKWYTAARVMGAEVVLKKP